VGAEAGRTSDQEGYDALLVVRSAGRDRVHEQVHKE